MCERLPACVRHPELHNNMVFSLLLLLDVRLGSSLLSCSLAQQETLTAKDPRLRKRLSLVRPNRDRAPTAVHRQAGLYSAFCVKLVLHQDANIYHSPHLNRLTIILMFVAGELWLLLSCVFVLVMYGVTRYKLHKQVNKVVGILSLTLKPRVYKTDDT